MRSVNDHNKAIRKDNKLVKRVKEIEIEISEVCQKLSSELGVDIGWSDAIEIAHGMPLKQLWKMMRWTTSTAENDGSPRWLWDDFEEEFKYNVLKEIDRKEQEKEKLHNKIQEKKLSWRHWFLK